MKENINVAAGTSVTLVLRDKEYKFRLAVINDLFLLAEHLKINALRTYRNSLEGGIEVYKCNVCEGTGKIKAKDGTIYICNTCKGKGSINTSHEMMLDICKQEFTFQEAYNQSGTPLGARFIIWLCIKEYHSELTLEDVGKLFDFGDAESIYDVVNILISSEEIAKNLEKAKKERDKKDKEMIETAKKKEVVKIPNN